MSENYFRSIQTRHCWLAQLGRPNYNWKNSHAPRIDKCALIETRTTGFSPAFTSNPKIHRKFSFSAEKKRKSRYNYFKSFESFVWAEWRTFYVRFIFFGSSPFTSSDGTTNRLSAELIYVFLEFFISPALSVDSCLWVEIFTPFPPARGLPNSGVLVYWAARPITAHKRWKRS